MISLSLLLVYTILGNDKLIRNTVRGDTNRGGGTISGLSNYKDAEVSGQSTSSFPSFYTNVRATNAARSYNWPWGYSNGDTYMVGGNQGQGGKAQWFTSGSYPKANVMNFYRNYRKLRSDYQKGQKHY